MVQVSKRRPATPQQAARCSGPLDALLDPVLFKALGDPTRAKLLACLAMCGRPCSVSEVAACCHVDFSVVSRHLASMRLAGVLAASKVGRTVTYEVRYDDLVGALKGLADTLAAYRPQPLAPAKRRATR